jgi:hypothetical protein
VVSQGSPLIFTSQLITNIMKNIILVPKKNLKWCLNDQVKNWINLTTKQERLNFINSLNDDLLDNLYIWRLGFNMPDLKSEKINNLLSL